MTRIQLFCCFVVVLTITTIGCGKNISLKGKVVFSDDQSPLTVGAVCFESGTFLAQGELMSDGSYVVGTTAAKNGLPPGSYRVYIAGAVETEQVQNGPVSVPVNIPLIDSKYSNSASSGLSVEVNRSTRRFDITVDRANR